eukprot:TRINITY_DN40124_c0_g1_i1.p1 TRINITY_DN40124_c0_g1~~TRINITY_DN40124_c0_g1_i1.p1  ORF type:complete len:182 (+),score=27.99 TRINITY_DN40124_c0_g1_i1:154-699(+)
MGFLAATAEPPLPWRLRFLPWGWAGSEARAFVEPREDLARTQYCEGCDWPWDAQQWGAPSSWWRFLSPGAIARRFNHSKVDLIKMDCEGAEYSDGLLDELIGLRPEQIILDMHPEAQVLRRGGRAGGGAAALSTRLVTASEWVTVQEKLMVAGYRQVWAGSLKPRSREYTFARRDLTDLQP